MESIWAGPPVILWTAWGKVRSSLANHIVAEKLWESAILAGVGHSAVRVDRRIEDPSINLKQFRFCQEPGEFFDKILDRRILKQSSESPTDRIFEFELDGKFRYRLS